jgi:hypothetical protein
MEATRGVYQGTMRKERANKKGSILLTQNRAGRGKMTKLIEVSTQEQFDAAVNDKNIAVVRTGVWVAYGYSQVTACGSSQVTACDSSQVTAYDYSQVTAYDSSQVTAYDSSQVRAYDSSQVTAYDSSQVRAYDSSQVTAYGYSQVRAYGYSQVRAYDYSQVTAYGYSQVTAYDYSRVRACGKNSFVLVRSTYSKVSTPKRQRKTLIPQYPGSVQEWLGSYGIKSKGESVVLFKGVNDNFTSNHNNTAYAIGTETTAPDWEDTEAIECGKGLHFCPDPALTLQFIQAKHYVACEINVADLRIYDGTPMYPNKIRARACRNLYEVDINGNRI